MRDSGARLPGLKITALLFVYYVSLRSIASFFVPSFYCYNAVMIIAYLIENLED